MSTGLFPELTLEKLVCLCHEYYSIFLLQQGQASALAMKYSCDKQQWYLISFLLGVKLREECMRKGIF